MILHQFWSQTQFFNDINEKFIIHHDLRGPRTLSKATDANLGREHTLFRQLIVEIQHYIALSEWPDLSRISGKEDEDAMSSSSGISSSSLSNSSFYHRERGGGAAGEAASATSIKLLDEILEEDNSSFDGGGRSRYDHKYFYDTHLLHFLPNVEDIVFSHLPTSTPPCKRFARSVV